MKPLLLDTLVNKELEYPSISLFKKIFFRVFRWYKILGIDDKSLRRYFCLPGDDVTDATILFGAFEADRLKAINMILDNSNFKEGILIDVGAHFGLYTVELKKYFTKSYLIEANPILAKICEANILWNNINAEVFAVGAANCNQKTNISINRDGNLGASKLEKSNNGESFEIDLLPLDELLIEKLEKSSNKNIFLKIDVEGLEKEVIEGSLNLINKFRPLIHLEIAPDNKQIHDILSKLSFNYDFYLLDFLSHSELDSFYRHNKYTLKGFFLRLKRVFTNKVKLEKINNIYDHVFYEGILLVPKVQ